MFSGVLNSDLGPIHDPRMFVRKISALLQKDFGYTDPKILGAGSFGVVFSLKHPEKEDKIAIKCVYLEDVREGEKELWSGLDHPNIVPLLRYTEFRTINVACFEMEAYQYDLRTVVKQNEFLTSSEALQKLKTWFYQVLSGLNFLHIRQLYHLDLKSDNIFISHKTSSALIGDFTFLRRTTSNIGSDEVGLPYMYRPPETSWRLKDKKSIDGRYLDLWSYGVLSFEILTDFYLVRSFSYLCTEAPYVSIREGLQEEVFTHEMETALPAVKITESDVQMALNFIHSFLKTDPSARLTAEAGMQHIFLVKRDVENAHFDSLRQLTDTTRESTCGPITYLNQIEESTSRKRVTNWFRRCFTALGSFFRRWLPCTK